MQSTATDAKNVSADRLDDYRPRARARFHDAQYLGTDGTDAVHYWSIYHQTVLVFHAGSSHTIETPARMSDGTRIDTLRDWVEYIRRRHGWSTLRVSGGLVDDLAAALRVER